MICLTALVLTKLFFATLLQDEILPFDIAALRIELHVEASSLRRGAINIPEAVAIIDWDTFLSAVNNIVLIAGAD